MSSCGLGSWARVCAVGYPFRGNCLSNFFFFGDKRKFFCGLKANSIQPQHARSPPGGTTHHKPCETSPRLRTGRLPYPPAFPLSFDSHTNVLG
ncbi:unnamed protein product [Tuber melanosporum]|uniref:(Perigord truffle) hypothetical protein n=1 Tax=Tuber melanosporum (strain Mel28) TaxID=656061 RepID=D5G7X0_TUBMM|nr:uncharacterized protein GSTUM_00002686001 [Tuber melanosporum]CAZ80613.1 unnamed protein product [Tuber melanosporum]